MTKKSVLFVCLGNICRSPAAEGIFLHLLSQNQLNQNFIVDSAGTNGLHNGQLPDPRMRSEALKRGINLISKSRKFTVQDFTKFDYIIAMDDSNVSNILKLDPKELFHCKVSKMTDYASGSFMNFSEVPDPYYGAQDGFALVFDLLENCCSNLLKKINELM